MTIHLRTFAAGALFTLAVATSMGSAASTPKPTHGIGTAVIKALPAVGAPSDHDRLNALMRRVDRLQNQLAEARSIALEADTSAGNAEAMTQCITGGVALIERADGTIVGADSGSLGDDSDTFVMPTLDDSCVAS